MPKGFRKGYEKPTSGDIPKAWWLAKWPGVLVYDETRVGKDGGPPAKKSGLKVFLYDYDWGPRRDGTPMVGKKLGIAPFWEDDQGRVVWKGRQRAGRAASGAPKLKWQFDVVAINPAVGHRLADAIKAVVDGVEMTEEEAEKKIQRVADKVNNEEMERLMKFV